MTVRIITITLAACFIAFLLVAMGAFGPVAKNDLQNKTCSYGCYVK